MRLDSLLFVTQRFDRIEIGGLERRVSAENNSDEGANPKSDGDPVKWDDRGDLHEIRGGVAANNSKNDPRDTAEFAKDNRFHDELRHDVALLGADGAADSDFA